MINFKDTKQAYRAHKFQQLVFTYTSLVAISFDFIVKLTVQIIDLAFKKNLPIKQLLLHTIFKQFCGGESLRQCQATLNKLEYYNIYGLLDYGVENSTSQFSINKTIKEIKKTIDFASINENIPFSVFKPTAVTTIDLLSKVSNATKLTAKELEEWAAAKKTFLEICSYASSLNVAIMIDAEESWIQPAVDEIVLTLMRKFNKEHSIVFQTVQMYRHDRLDYLKQLIQDAEENSYNCAIKLVRGAYLEKENKRSKLHSYTSPIHTSKMNTDSDFNKAIELLISKLDHTSVFIGTHNQESIEKTIELINKNKLSPTDKRIYFAQLYGMSDHLSYNLAVHKYNVVKYIPYGPLKEVIPYLLRRIQENSGISKQTKHERSLLGKEIIRRIKTMFSFVTKNG